MTAGKPKNDLPTVHSLAFHRLSYSGERVPFLFSLVPSTAVLRICGNTGRRNGSQSLRENNGLQEPFKTQPLWAPPSMTHRDPSMTHSPVEVSQILHLYFSNTKWGPIATHIHSLTLFTSAHSAGIFVQCSYKPLSTSWPALYLSSIFLFYLLHFFIMD